MRSLLVLAVTTLLCGSVVAKNDDKVKIAVYYESLCPDSKNFLTNQLAPLWRDFRGGIKVKLVPYGKSTHELVNNHWMFTCHHRENECYGNKIQACILKDKSLQDQEKMDLVLCLMSQAHPDKSLDTCLRQVGKSGESRKLKGCALGDQGGSLLATYGDKTAAVMSPLQFVPTIVINEKFDQGIQDEAYEDLKRVVCRVARVKPNGC